MTWFLSGFLLSMSLCMDLGMVNVAIIRTGITRGAIPSFMVGLGSCFGDLAYAVLSLAGMAALLQYSPVRWVIWIGGSLVLSYLAYSMVRAALHPRFIEPHPEEGSRSSEPPSLFRDFMQGILLALSSPTSILWFATVGGSIIASQAVPHAAALVMFYIGFFSAGVVWSFSIAALSGYGGRRLGPFFVKSVSWASAVLFVYFAGQVFLSGYRDFIMK